MSVQIHEFGLKQVSEERLDPLYGRYLMESYAYRSFERNFYKLSVKHRLQSVQQAVRIPFFVSQPTFESLGTEQSRWYFYWRERALQGEYVETDYCYVLLLVYELLNYGLEPNPDRAVSLLIQLYEQYQEDFTRLDRFVPEWIGDLLFEGGRKDLAKEWYSRSAFPHCPYANLDRYNSPELITRLTFPSWNKHIPAIPRNPFSNTHEKELRQFYKKAILEANDYYMEVEQKSAIDYWFPKTKKKNARLFEGAVVSSIRKSRTRKVLIREAIPTAHQELETLLRFTQNLVRRNKGVKGRVKVEENNIPEALRARLKQRFAVVIEKGAQTETEKIPERPSPAFKMDRTLIKKLQRDSEIIQKKLVDTSELLQEEVITKPKSLPTGNNTYNPLAVDLSASSKEPVQEFQNFVLTLSPLEQQFMQLFRAGSLSVHELNTFARQHGLLPTQLLDQINEKSYEMLGYPILEQEGDAVRIEEF